MHTVPPGRLFAGCPLVLLERNNLKRHTKYFRSLLSQFAVFADLVAGSAESTSDNLLAQKLRHKRPKPNDMSHRIAVPALSQHSHTDNATNVATGRMQRSLQPPREFNKAFGIDG